MAKASKVAIGKTSKLPMTPRVRWAAEPAEKDYPAAESYLRLLGSPETVQALVTSLAQAETVQQHAKDIIRASRLPLLPIDDVEVKKDLARIAAGTPLAPILLVRGDLHAGLPLQIADGYHRVCASYYLGEDTDIPCRLVALGAVVE